MADSAPRGRHLSLIRSFHLADLCTLANGACGMSAVLLAIAHRGADHPRVLLMASGLVVAALVFDVCDGRIARWRQTHGAFGRELDSLADIVSFGVAPAAIAYAAGFDTTIDALILVFFMLCGLSRLARYNVTADALAAGGDAVRYFEGTPIPSSVLPLGLLMLGVVYGQTGVIRAADGTAVLHLWTLLFAVSGCLMVSRSLRIPKP